MPGSGTSAPLPAYATSAFYPFRPLPVAAAPPPPPAVAVLPPAPAGGSFHDAAALEGDVGFWNDDAVKRREIGSYSDRYVERVTLRNNGLLVYEMLKDGAFADTTDAELIKADLDQPSFRERGIGFDAAKVEKAGPFTYLTQSSANDVCFVFRAKFRHAGAPPVAAAPASGNLFNEEAYGNVCYAKSAKDAAAVKAEMLDILSHVRFGTKESNELIAAAASETLPPPPAPAPPPKRDESADAHPVLTNLDQCHYSVDFAGKPVAKSLRQTDPLAATAYHLDSNGYSEDAACSCQKDVDYAKASQFDAVENARLHAEKIGFKLQKATFSETPELGKELAYEAAAKHDSGETFLIGRNFYGQCGLTVEATGSSYSDLLKARKFVESVAASSEPVIAASGKGEEPSEAIIAGSPSAATGSKSEAPIGAGTPPAGLGASNPTPPAIAAAGAPRPLVVKAGLSDGNEKPSDATTEIADATTPAPHPAGEPPPADAVARLRRLKELLEQKLITPAEYDTKRKAILNSL